MDPLAGWTVAVTAQRRADEQAALLQRRGADVVLAPLVRAVPAPEPEVRAATLELLAAPVDLVVVTSGVGLRSWLAWCWSWGFGEGVGQVLGRAEVWARGGKALGALAGEGVPVAWRPPGDTLEELVVELERRDVAGRRIAVQLHGGDLTWCTDRLRAAGAEVVPVPVYRVVADTDGPAAERLGRAAAKGDLDAVTLTSAAAVAALAALPGVVDDLRRTGAVCACVGPVTARAATAAGLPAVVEAAPARLGSMVRSLGEELAAKGTTVGSGELVLRHQGARATIDGREVRLTPRERRLLEVIVAGEGAVVSKERLASAAWDAPVDGHAVEVAVNRLRRKLGPAASALETSTRRGYRIAI